MDRLTPEEFEELFNAYNRSFSDLDLDIDWYNQLANKNVKDRWELINKTKDKYKGTNVTSDRDFSPKKYNKWYHLGYQDDISNIMDSINYSHQLLGNSQELDEDSLRDFSEFLFNVFQDEGISRQYNKNNLFKLYNYFKDNNVGSITDNINPFPLSNTRLKHSSVYKNYEDKMEKLGIRASPSDFVNRYILEDNAIKPITPSKSTNDTFDRNYQWDTLKHGLPPTDTPEGTETTDTTPKVEIAPKKDFYSMIKDEYNQDEKVRSKYHKLGWWK